MKQSVERHTAAEVYESYSDEALVASDVAEAYAASPALEADLLIWDLSEPGSQCPNTK